MLQKMDRKKKLLNQYNLTLINIKFLLEDCLKEKFKIWICLLKKCLRKEVNLNKIVYSKKKMMNLLEWMVVKAKETNILDFLEKRNKFLMF